MLCNRVRPSSGSLWHAGVPLHVVCRAELTPQQLRTALSSIPLASLKLHDSVALLPPETLSPIVSAIARSASTLVALHGLPRTRIQRGAAIGLAAFTRLRSLTLRQTTNQPARLQAAHLPPSLQELTLSMDVPRFEAALFTCCLPKLVAVDGLHSLRRITLANQRCNRWYNLDGHGHDEEERSCPLLPPSLKVGPAVHGPEFAQGETLDSFAGPEPICRLRSLCIMLTRITALAQVFQV